MIYNCRIITLNVLCLQCLSNQIIAAITFSILVLLDSVLIVGMVWVVGIQEIEFRIIQLILSNPTFKVWSISAYKDSGLVHNVLKQVKV